MVLLHAKNKAVSLKVATSVAHVLMSIPQKRQFWLILGSSISGILKYIFGQVINTYKLKCPPHGGLG